MCESDFWGRNFLEIFIFESEISFLPPPQTRELCLVRAHDRKLTKDAEKAQNDLAEALLEAEKNAKWVGKAYIAW